MCRLQHATVGIESPHRAESKETPKSPELRQDSSDRLRIKTPAMFGKWVSCNLECSLLPARKSFMRESSNREVTDKPKSADHFTHSAPVAKTAGTMLSIEIVQTTKRGLTREPTECDTRGQKVPFESSANQVAHEMDECNGEPQSVHVPHLRAIDEKSLFACDATVDPEAQSVPQAFCSEECD